MSYESPESVFATAQDSMERGDWEAFFSCLDRTDLMRLAAMGIPVDEEADVIEFRQCVEYGIPIEELNAVKSLADDIRVSSCAMMTERESSSSGQQEILQRSLHHRDLVKAFGKAIETCLRSVTDIAAFTAMAERRKRAKLGGGSVSSRLYIGESLVDIIVDGKKASGTRLMNGGWKEPIRFVQKKGRWYIRFMPKSRSVPK